MASKRGFKLRGADRHKTNGIRCAEGEVIDLSATGLRFVTDAKPDFTPGNVRAFTLNVGGHKVRLSAVIVWLKKTKLLGKQFQVGVRFVNLRPGMSYMLDEIGATGRIPERFFSDPEPEAETQTPEPETQEPIAVHFADLYEILGLDEDAPIEAVHESYRRLAKVTHPDISSDPDAEERFMLIAKAYRVLKDPELRAEYDEARRQQRAA